MNITEYETLIRTLLADVAKQKKIATFETPQDVLRDSLDNVEFIVLLETHLDIEIDDAEIMSLDTTSVSGLAQSILQLANQAQVANA